MTLNPWSFYPQLLLTRITGLHCHHGCFKYWDGAQGLLLARQTSSNYIPSFGDALRQVCFSYLFHMLMILTFIFFPGCRQAWYQRDGAQRSLSVSWDWGDASMLFWESRKLVCSGRRDLILTGVSNFDIVMQHCLLQSSYIRTIHSIYTKNV